LEIHLFFDLLAYSVGTFLTWRVFCPKEPLIVDENIRYAYYTVVIMGAFIGAIVIGSLNVYYSLEAQEHFLLGKSVLGAIVGAVVAVEIFKKVMKIQGSTGAYAVPSLAIGIAIGRLGCFFAGLDDYTYGIETHFLLGYDFGDNLLRHPVQLYESSVMALFFIYVIWIYIKDINYFEKKIFYQFILVYSIQRFTWEFLKPYETIWLGLNIFQFFCLGLMLYALYFLKKGSR
jgi:prolipoprotein diacylglyceryltransferase